jgi:hypothetical protein
MVDFILTRTGTLAASDNEILLAATALNFSEGRKGRVGIILAASPSPGRNALLAVGAGSALLLERSDRAALANAITDDALRTVIQSQMEAVNRLTFTDENVPSSKP